MNYTTQVAVHRTVGEIQKLLVRAGARQIMTEHDDDGRTRGVAFAVETRHGMRRYTLPVDPAPVEKVLRADLKIANRYKNTEQAERVAWRIIKDWLEAQLAIIETDMVSLDEVMLPYMQVDAGRTVYDLYLERQIKELNP